MAIVQTGSTLQYPINSTANTGTVSSTITVPADTQKVLVFASAYQGTANGLAAMTFTKGGADVAMTKVSGGDSIINNWMGAIFWMDLPDTGSNKTLKWDWIGTGTSVNAEMLFAVQFWKGLQAGVRDGNGVQAASANSAAWTTPTLTAVSGDKIVAFAFGYCTSSTVEGTIDSWSNVTELLELTHNSWADGSLATGDPAGNTTVAALTETGWDDGGIVAVVLKPAASLLFPNKSQSPILRRR